MSRHVEIGDSIECNRSIVVVRKIVSDKFIKMEALDGTSIYLHKYKTKKRALITIIEQLTPLQCKMCLSSHLDNGDELEGDVVEIYTSKKVFFTVISNYSNVHGIQGDSVSAFTYAKIVIPWRFVLQREIAV